MEANNKPTQLHLFIKPVREYLINGPIDPADLAHLDFVQTYADHLGSYLSVHFMLEKVSVDGAPDWWEGSIAEFEEKFHEEYQLYIRDLDKASDFLWTAAEAEVQEKRCAPLPEDATKEQVKDFIAHGRKRLLQTIAVEVLLDMWCEALGV